MKHHWYQLPARWQFESNIYPRKRRMLERRQLQPMTTMMYFVNWIGLTHILGFKHHLMCLSSCRPQLVRRSIYFIIFFPHTVSIFKPDWNLDLPMLAYDSVCLFWCNLFSKHIWFCSAWTVWTHSECNTGNEVQFYNCRNTFLSSNLNMIIVLFFLILFFCW